MATKSRRNVALASDLPRGSSLARIAMLSGRLSSSGNLSSAPSRMRRALVEAPLLRADIAACVRACASSSSAPSRDPLRESSSIASIHASPASLQRPVRSCTPAIPAGAWARSGSSRPAWRKALIASARRSSSLSMLPSCTQAPVSRGIRSVTWRHSFAASAQSRRRCASRARRTSSRVLPLANSRNNWGVVLTTLCPRAWLAERSSEGKYRGVGAEFQAPRICRA